jgi:hypothetical protein
MFTVDSLTRPVVAKLRNEAVCAGDDGVVSDCLSYLAGEVDGPSAERIVEALNDALARRDRDSDTDEERRGDYLRDEAKDNSL